MFHSTHFALKTRRVSTIYSRRLTNAMDSFLGALHPAMRVSFLFPTRSSSKMNGKIGSSLFQPQFLTPYSIGSVQEKYLDPPFDEE